jgi:hypothetical protein
MPLTPRQVASFREDRKKLIFDSGLNKTIKEIDNQLLQDKLDVEIIWNKPPSNDYYKSAFKEYWDSSESSPKIIKEVQKQPFVMDVYDNDIIVDICVEVHRLYTEAGWQVNYTHDNHYGKRTRFTFVVDINKLRRT